MQGCSPDWSRPNISHKRGCRLQDGCNPPHAPRTQKKAVFRLGSAHSLQGVVSDNSSLAQGKNVCRKNGIPKPTRGRDVTAVSRCRAHTLCLRIQLRFPQGGASRGRDSGSIRSPRSAQADPTVTRLQPVSETKGPMRRTAPQVPELHVEGRYVRDVGPETPWQPPSCSKACDANRAQFPG